MVGGTLYTYPDNFRAFKALIAAQYSGANVKVDPKFVFGETNQSKDFLAKFPTGKVPAFQADDGTCLTESNAIAYYLANAALRGGSDPVHGAQVIQWMQFADNEILPPALTWILPILGTLQYSKQQTERAKDDVKKALTVLNQHLLHHTFLVGERISLADIVVTCNLLQLYKHVMDAGFRKPFGNVNRWFNTVVNQAEVKKVVGAFKLCEKMEQFDPKKAGAHGHHQGQGHGDSKKDHSKKDHGKKDDDHQHHKKPAKAPAAAAKAPAAAKPKEPEGDAEEEEMKPAKEKDPFAEIPKGNFDMDDFKRFYSNNEEDKSVPYFWEKFDKDHYSIWRCDYMYNDELTMVFMSCNLISGMFQRLEKLRKNAFASMALFGENNNSAISGVWVFRGQDLAFELCDDWKTDYKSYKWEKLDPTADETKALVDQYFKWTGNDKSGKSFNQGKIFK